MKKKPVNSAGLHAFVKTGGKPKDYVGTKGINKNTVPNCTCGTKNAKIAK